MIRSAIPGALLRAIGSGVWVGRDGSDGFIAISGEYYRLLHTAMVRGVGGRSGRSCLKAANERAVSECHPYLVMRGAGFCSAGLGEACRVSKNLAGWVI